MATTPHRMSRYHVHGTMYCIAVLYEYITHFSGPNLLALTLTLALALALALTLALALALAPPTLALTVPHSDVRGGAEARASSQVAGPPRIRWKCGALISPPPRPASLPYMEISRTLRYYYYYYDCDYYDSYCYY